MATQADLNAAYPQLAPLWAIPDVANAVGGLPTGASTNQIVAAIMGTNWWRTHSQTERNFIGMQLGDPAELMRQHNNSALSILSQAAGMGVPLSLSQASDLANQGLQQGWDAATMTYHIAQYAQLHGDQFGSISASQTDLQGMAAQQGINVSDATTFDWAKRIASGTATSQGFQDYARGVAAMQHPYWAKQINEGATVRTLADPYIQNAARLLEVSPDQIDISDAKWQFTTQNKDGSHTPMSQAAWNEKIMSDPKYGWDRTDNAKQTAYDMVKQLETTFGNRA